MFGGGSDNSAIDAENAKVTARNKKIKLANKRKLNRISARSKKQAGKSSLISGDFTGIVDEDENGSSSTLG